MAKYLFIYAIAVSLLFALAVRRTLSLKSENQRLSDNMETLATEAEHYRTRLGEEVVATEALRLQCNELRRIRKEDAALIRRLRTSLRRVESISETSLTSDIIAPIHIVADSCPTNITPHHEVSSPRHFHWSDAWVEIDGTIIGNEVVCEVHTIDSLHTIIHRARRKGRRVLKQSIVSLNPHTHIVATEYIVIERGKRH